MSSMPPSLTDLSTRQTARIGRMTIVAAVLVTLGLLGLLARVAQLQWRPPAPIAARVGQGAGSLNLPGQRGAILDAKGRVLASTRIGYRLFVDPHIIEDPMRFSAQAAYALGRDPAAIDQAIGMAGDSRYVVLDDLLNEREVARVRELNLRGLALQPRPVREYLGGEMAGQLLGTVGAEHQGLEGVEFAMHRGLAGRTGTMRARRDARRRPFWVERGDYTPPTDGKPIRLSIDVTVQTIAERELAAACEHFEATLGEVVVMHARTGQLLAVVNWPFVSPDELFDAEDEAHRRNRCATDAYEPGSTFKPFVWAAATSLGIADPDEKIDCTTSGVWRAECVRRLHDAHAHGVLDWRGVLIKSSNIGMAQIGERMGAPRLHRTVTAFGFGRKPGADLPGEARGIVLPLDRWNGYSITSVPMGQEIAVTPLQLVKAFSVFANGGVMVTPSWLADERHAPIRQRVLDEPTADLTRQMLGRVISEGTGRRAKSTKYRLWGKTGTAQVPDKVNGGYVEDGFVASFVCGAPLRNPQIIVAVIVHQPNRAIGHYGGTVAAPAAKNIVEQTLAYLGVPAIDESDKDALQVAHATE